MTGAAPGRHFNLRSSNASVSEIGKVCIITACGGFDTKRWLPLIGKIENYARDEGCVRVRIFGRTGWLRVLEGYEGKHIIMDEEMD